MELKALVESLLFVADRAVKVDELATALQARRDEVELALQSLAADYAERGIRLQRHNEQVQLVSAPDAAPHIERFLGLETTGRLTLPALEALSIVCYRQPVTRAQVEAIRGVDSTSVLHSLQRRGLIEEIGRADSVGHPILYGTTFEFLQQFGLQSLQDLPDWRGLNRGLGPEDLRESS